MAGGGDGGEERGGVRGVWWGWEGVGRGFGGEGREGVA